jgi:hypothetical protein
MVVTPTLRGLFGIDIDAQAKTITVNPHLPANWDHAEIRNLRVGSETVTLVFAQARGETAVSISGAAQSGIRLIHGGENSPADAATHISRPVVEIVPLFRKPVPGDRTQSTRVVAQSYGPHRLTVTLEGLAGSRIEFPLVLAAPAPRLHAGGAVLESQPHQDASGKSVEFPAIAVAFPPGEGWKTVTVTLTW